MRLGQEPRECQIDSRLFGPLRTRVTLFCRCPCSPLQLLPTKVFAEHQTGGHRLCYATGATCPETHAAVFPLGI